MLASQRFGDGDIIVLVHNPSCQNQYYMVNGSLMEVRTVHYIAKKILSIFFQKISPVVVQCLMAKKTSSFHFTLSEYFRLQI